MRRMMVAAVTLGLLTTGVTAVPAQAAAITVCVNKKSGEVRVPKKKCKKGWKKVSWNRQGGVGPQGQTGPAGVDGPVTLVKDATGRVVGRFMGLYPAGIMIMFVLVDNGLYVYTGDGKVMSPGSGSPNFLAADCTGPGFITSDSALTTSLLTQSAGGPTRMVWRSTVPALGPARAWALTSSTQLINQAIFELDETGTCVPDGSHNGTIVLLETVTAPQDATAPLSFG